MFSILALKILVNREWDLYVQQKWVYIILHILPKQNGDSSLVPPLFLSFRKLVAQAPAKVGAWRRTWLDISEYSGDPSTTSIPAQSVQHEQTYREFLSSTIKAGQSSTLNVWACRILSLFVFIQKLFKLKCWLCPCLCGTWMLLDIHHQYTSSACGMVPPSVNGTPGVPKRSPLW